MPEHIFAGYQDKIKDIREKIIVFSVMRNEIFRLGGWLAHYRKIGCKTFVVVDNGSSDGTLAALQNQPDVLVIQTADSFSQAAFGVDWLNKFRSLLTADHWVLFADADEFLVYPGWPDRTVEDVASEIEAAGCDALWAFLLDMYPNSPIEPVDPPLNADLFSLAPCFDANYHVRYPPKKPWQKDYPSLEVIGGPRLRSLSTFKRELRITWFDRFLRGQLDRVLPYAPDRFLPLIFTIFPQPMPSLFKSPLAKVDAKIRYLNNHDLAGAKYFIKNSVVCHFKFLGDFAKKVHTEVSRKEHYRRGAEYFNYQNILKKNKGLDFRYSGSLQFESAAQIEMLGLFMECSVANPKTPPL